MAQYIAKVPNCWIEGQIIKMNKWHSGYFVTFKDLDDEGYTLEASTFQNAVSTKLDGFNEGDRFVANVKPSFGQKGKLSVNIFDIDKVGTGNILQQIEELRQKLMSEGLFGVEHKSPLPEFINCIGLVCGKGAQAEDDVIQNVHRRWPNIKFKVREVSVGNSPKTPVEVLRAAQKFDADNEVDVIIIARGGGALEEVVFPFSNESLLRGIFSIVKPVISAIGHETDIPLLNFVADFAASTPTDAAKQVTPSIDFEQELVGDLSLRFRSTIKARIDNEAEFIRQMLSRPILSDPLAIFDSYENEITEIMRSLHANITLHLMREQSGIDSAISTLSALNPDNTLRRGYSLAFIDGKVVKSVKDVKVKSSLNIRLSDGELKSEVKEIIE